MWKIIRRRLKSTVRAICELTIHSLKILRLGRYYGKAELQMAQIMLCRWLRSKFNSCIWFNGNGTNYSLDPKMRPQAALNTAPNERTGLKQVRLVLMASRLEVLSLLCWRSNCRSTHPRISYLRPRSRIVAFCILVLRQITLVVTPCDTNLPSNQIFPLPMLLSTIRPQTPLWLTRQLSRRRNHPRRTTRNLKTRVRRGQRIYPVPQTGRRPVNYSKTPMKSSKTSQLLG